MKHIYSEQYLVAVAVAAAVVVVAKAISRHGMVISTRNHKFTILKSTTTAIRSTLFVVVSLHFYM